MEAFVIISVIFMGILISFDIGRNVYYFIKNKNTNNLTDTHNVLTQVAQSVSPLSFEEINVVIDSVCSEIVTNKYALHYRLKEIKIIPNMKEDAAQISLEIMESFSDDFISEVYRFYTKEYFVAMVTRKVQFFLVDYTDKHKPRYK